MKSLNLRSIASLLLLSVAFTGCKKSQNIEKLAKSENTENIAQRTGVIDYYVIFGGMYSPGRAYTIKFPNDSIADQISNDLTPFGITATSNFPISVTVTTKPDNTLPINFVTITTLKINK